MEIDGNAIRRVFLRDPEVKFRTRGKAVVPYIEAKAKRYPLPIKGIVAAPNAHPSIVAAFSAMLHKNGYASVPVVPSVIPFRD